MDIKGMANVSNTDNKKFIDGVGHWVNKFQENGDSVELQYSTNITADQQICFSCLIISKNK